MDIFLSGGTRRDVLERSMGKPDHTFDIDPNSEMGRAIREDAGAVRLRVGGEEFDLLPSDEVDGDAEWEWLFADPRSEAALAKMLEDLDEDRKASRVKPIDCKPR